MSEKVPFRPLRRATNGIVQEVDMVNKSNLYSAPPQGGHKTVSATNLPEPDDLPISAAAALPCIQVDRDGYDKVREGEDWRREPQKSTMFRL